MAGISSLRRPPITGGSLSKSLIFKWSSRIRAMKKKQMKKKKSPQPPPPPVEEEEEALRRLQRAWSRPFIEHLPRTPTLEFDADHYSCEFPQELLREILVRLPSVESIIKSTAVCKSWRSVIKSPTFIDAHLSRRRNQNRNGVDEDDDGCLLLLERGGLDSKSYDLYWDKSSACGLGGEFFPVNETNCKSLVTPLVFRSIRGDKVLISYFKLAGTCNGLLCLTNNFDCYYSVPTILCNPLLRKFVALPRPSIAIAQEYWAPGRKHIQLTSAFGYDPRTNDYKVLRLSMSDRWGPQGREGDTEYGVELYSLARGSWKILSPLSPAAFPFPRMLERIFDALRLKLIHVFCNAAVHWLLTAYRRIETVIASFDMVTESFRQMEVPQALRSFVPQVFLSIHEENSLALIEVDLKRPFCDLHLWVMQEYGVAGSWTKLYSVPLGSLYQYHYSAPYPFLACFKSNGEQVFRLGYDSPSHHIVLLKVDFKTKQVNSGLVDPRPDYDNFMDSFVESLVLLDQSNALSY